jgi:hypothetical protein
VRVLFEGKFNTSALSLAQAWALTNRFAKHYNHAVPFDTDVFDEIWNRCRDLRCGTARRKAEGMLKDGSWIFTEAKQRGARGSVAPSPEPSPATPDLSPEPEVD